MSQHSAPARPKICRLSNHVIDLIAAGEVIERPAAALKELTENALDSGATAISVALLGGGIDRIEVQDNGCGMSPEDMLLAVERHCTSKLPNGDLTQIRTLGFRGEALPSIGASARLRLVSRVAGAETAWSLSVEGGHVSRPEPAAGLQGTCAVVDDLFFATPARRKFLKSARVEGGHAETVIRRIALSAPNCAVRLTLDNRVVLDVAVQSTEERAKAILGVEDGLSALDERRREMHLSGYICGPATTRNTAAGQFMTVNGRPVSDPLLKTAIRVAYRSLIESGRFPILALDLRLSYEMVDVNVHPAKTELRFAQEAEVRSFVIGAVQRALGFGAGHTGHRVAFNPRRNAIRYPAAANASTGYDLSAFEKNFANPPHDAAPRVLGQGQLGTSHVAPQMASDYAAEAPMQLRTQHQASMKGAVQSSGMSEGHDGFAPSARHLAPVASQLSASHPLGAAVAQVLDTYIIAVADDGNLVLVDQHAAHERLTHEALLRQWTDGCLDTQRLLLPEVVSLTAQTAQALLAFSDSLTKLGLEIEAFGADSVVLRTMPVLLQGGNAASLIRDLADELSEDALASPQQSDSLERRVDAVIARMACHGSIRAGRRLKPEEMSALLRQMEATPRANTCSHGRPTWLKLSKQEIERLFGRR